MFGVNHDSSFELQSMHKTEKTASWALPLHGCIHERGVMHHQGVRAQLVAWAFQQISVQDKTTTIEP